MPSKRRRSSGGDPGQERACRRRPPAPSSLLRVPPDAGALVLAFSEPFEKHALRRACRSTALWPCAPDTVASVSFHSRGPYLTYGRWERTPPGPAPIEGGWWRETVRVVRVARVPFGGPPTAPKRGRGQCAAGPPQVPFGHKRGNVLLPGTGWAWLPLLFPRATVVVVPRVDDLPPPPPEMGVELVWDMLNACACTGGEPETAEADQPKPRALRAHACGSADVDRMVERILPGRWALVDTDNAAAHVPAGVRVSFRGWPPLASADAVTLPFAAAPVRDTAVRRHAVRATQLFVETSPRAVECLESVDWPRLREVRVDDDCGHAGTVWRCVAWALGSVPTLARLDVTCPHAGVPRALLEPLLAARVARGALPLLVGLHCAASGVAWLARHPGVVLEAVTLRLASGGDAVLDALAAPAVPGRLLLLELFKPPSRTRAAFVRDRAGVLREIVRRNPHMQEARVYGSTCGVRPPTRLELVAAQL